MTAHGPGTSIQTIVITDGDPAYLAMIEDFFLEEGYPRVVAVPSNSIEETIYREKPDIVLLDIHAAWPTPALRLLERLQHDPITAPIPIIICTTNARLVKALAARVLTQSFEVVEKPFELEELLVHVRARIGPPKRSNL